nr:hypothetical protein [uncultured Mediterraneibacter sp.]
MNTKRTFTAVYFTHKSDLVFFLCGVFMLLSEIWKQFTLTYILGDGRYNWWYLPFQLCSVPMYVLLYYPFIRRETHRRTLLVFLMTYCLMGGIAVFADTSGLHYPIPALTAHSYLWHVLLIVLGIASGITYLGKLRSDRKRTLFSRALILAFPLRPFIYSTIFYLFCCLIAELLNLSLDRFGTINMFYINPDYQMQQIVFRDLIPVLGNGGAILAYIAASVLASFLLFELWNLVFRFARRR